MTCDAAAQARSSVCKMFKRKAPPSPTTSIGAFVATKGDRLRFAIALNRRFGIDTAPAGGCRWLTISSGDLVGCTTWGKLLALAETHVVPET